MGAKSATEVAWRDHHTARAELRSFPEVPCTIPRRTQILDHKLAVGKPRLGVGLNGDSLDQKAYGIAFIAQRGIGGIELAGRKVLSDRSTTAF